VGGIVKKITILGAGMVGSAIIGDLSEEFDVTAVDLSIENLDKVKKKYYVKTIVADLTSESEIKNVVNDADLVVSAVPGFMGFETLRSIIYSGKNAVDISFFNHNPFELDELAKMSNLTVIVDCGVSPGLSNIVLGYLNQRVKIESYECYVGGLPINKEYPFNYKAPFSPVDVIEEYIRPARIKVDGKIILKEALSEIENIEFDKAGTLEAFNTDGLRTLLTTVEIPNMVEKTLRYQGHAELMKIFRTTGLFSSDEIKIGSNKIRPVDLTSQLLFSHWKPTADEKEFTVLRLKIIAKENSIKKEYVFDLFDEFDEKTSISSMARTTGYTCTSAARLILNDDFSRKGICPPEFIGSEPGCYQKVISMLEEKNIRFTLTEKEL
jgi:saccharopine dehydrogenase-like NADP-dependent oxidoreductase